MLGQCWDNVGTMLGQCWDSVGTTVVNYIGLRVGDIVLSKDAYSMRSTDSFCN
eukprot:gene25399-11174_t